MMKDRKKLSDIFRDAKTIFLDFDGPICSIFEGLSASRVAANILESLFFEEKDSRDLVAENDPLQILHLVEKRWPQKVTEAERLLTSLEILAVESAKPTLYANQFLYACRATGRVVAIVSNNSADAVQKYLNLHKLTECVSAVVGRETTPSLMKPSPHLLAKALAITGSSSVSSVFVGDSITDVSAAHSANIACIGYANKHGKFGRLRSVGADAVIKSIAELVEVIR